MGCVWVVHSILLNIADNLPFPFLQWSITLAKKLFVNDKISAL